MTISVKTRIRIAHIITRLDRGGSTDNTLYSALLADKDAFEVFVVSGPTNDPENDIQKRARAAGVIFVQIRELARPIRLFNDFMAFLKLAVFFRKYKIRIAHTHTSKAGILGRAAAWIARVPAIVHTPHGHIFWGYYGPMATRVFMLCEKICGWLGNMLIALTESEKNDYIKFKIEKQDKTTVIPSGLELAQYGNIDRNTARAKLNLSLNAFIIGTVARFEKIKNHEVLLKVASLLLEKRVDFTWVFAGDGELLPAFRDQAHALGLDKNMAYLGWQNDIASLLPALDLFVLASLNEGMGRVFVEAQASGLPVVGSDICGIVDVVKNNETGFLFNPGDARSMVEAIIKLKNDPELRGKMGEHGARNVAGAFDVQAMVSRLESVYRTLTAF